MTAALGRLRRSVAREESACFQNYDCSNATNDVVTMARCPDMTPAELRVMKVLWDLGRGSVSEVRAELGKRGQELAYTTVMTLLGRLAAKAAVVVDYAQIRSGWSTKSMMLPSTWRSVVHVIPTGLLSAM